MKLNEILNENFTFGSEIVEFLHSYGFNPHQYIIQSDLSVSMNCSASFNGITPTRTKIKELQLQFTRINGDFNISNNQLTTLKGCPTYVEGMFSCARNPKLTSLEFAPKFAGKGIRIMETGITSLVSVHEYIEMMHMGIGQLTADFYRIKEGGLGLLKITGLVELAMPGGRALPEPFEIIQKYLDDENSIFECQTELIDRGFEEYAQL